MAWTKSSFCSGGQCVEVDYARSSFCGTNNCVEVGFTRSSFCAGNNCVEAAGAHGQVLLRDGKLGDASPVLAFSPEAWQAFLELAPTVR